MRNALIFFVIELIMIFRGYFEIRDRENLGIPVDMILWETFPLLFLLRVIALVCMVFVIIFVFKDAKHYKIKKKKDKNLILGGMAITGLCVLFPSFYPF